MDSVGMDALERALPIVRGAVPATPAMQWPLLSARAGCPVWVKHENHAPTGAFKVRGGLVYLDRVRRDHPDVTGIVAATRGNHGQSVAFAARRYGVTATIVVPHGNSVEKNAAMRAWGAELIEHGEDFSESLSYARDLAVQRKLHFMPSFDPLLIAGVGTYAVELLEAAPDLAVVYVPIGMGSGICGMLAARAALGRRLEVVGVTARSAPAYARSLAAGHLVAAPAETRIADGLAVRVPNEAALALIRDGVDRIVEVDDDAIEAAMRALFHDTHNVAEGAGAAALAGLLQERDRLAGREAAIVMTGGNVDTEMFARVLAAA